jgi:hypothetical protein
LHNPDIANDVIDDTGGILAEITLRPFIVITAVGYGNIASLYDPDILVGIPDSDHCILVNDMG